MPCSRASPNPRWWRYRAQSEATGATAHVYLEASVRGTDVAARATCRDQSGGRPAAGTVPQRQCPICHHESATDAALRLRADLLCAWRHRQPHQGIAPRPRDRAHELYALLGQSTAGPAQRRRVQSCCKKSACAPPARAGRAPKSRRCGFACSSSGSRSEPRCGGSCCICRTPPRTARSGVASPVVSARDPDSRPRPPRQSRDTTERRELSALRRGASSASASPVARSPFQVARDLIQRPPARRRAIAGPDHDTQSAS